MKIIETTHLLLLSALWLFVAPFAAQSQEVSLGAEHPSAGDSSPDMPVFTFEGGTVTKLIEKMKTTFTADLETANVIVHESAANIRIQPLKLQGADAKTILKVMCHLTETDGPSGLTLTVDDNMIIIRTNDPNVRIPKKAARIFPLESILERSSMEDVMSLISKAFELSLSDPPSMSFHKETKALIVSSVDRIQEEQLHNVLQALNTPVAKKQPTLEKMHYARDLLRRELESQKESLKYRLEEFHENKNKVSPGSLALKEIENNLQKQRVEALGARLLEIEAKILEFELDED